MKLLYKIIACREVDGKKLLLPGYPPGQRELKPGDRIRIELPDGALVETAAQGIKPCIFDENQMNKLQLRVESGFYFAIELPHDFDVSRISPGGNVYLIDD